MIHKTLRILFALAIAWTHFLRPAIAYAAGSSFAAKGARMGSITYASAAQACVAFVKDKGKGVSGGTASYGSQGDIRCTYKDGKDTKSQVIAQVACPPMSSAASMTSCVCDNTLVPGPGGACVEASDPEAYTAKIRWAIRDVNARPAPPGYWGERFAQGDSAVDAYELQINPKNESYYLPHPKGGFVQFENLHGNTLQDGKLVGGNSIYHVANKPPALNKPILEEASRQVEAASAANLKVEWLVSDPQAASQLQALFAKQPTPIPVTVTHLPAKKP